MTGHLLLGVLSAFFVSQLIKFIIHIVMNKEIEWSFFIQNGGFPSSHSATVSSLALGLYLLEGNSSAFAVSIVLMVIVIADALGVRREVGRHAKVINKRLGTQFDELIGHSLSQVFFGILTGLSCALIFNLYI